MEAPVTTHRETTLPTVTVKIKDPTAAVKRHRVQRIVKKHLQQKYLLCGFAIHAFIATPAFLYGIVVESDYEYVIRIWPAIIYQSVSQICRSVLLHLTAKEQNESSIMKHIDINRNIYLGATITLCSALTISGGLYTSAWIEITRTTQIVAVTLYGVLGGIGSSIIFWRTHLIIEAVRPKEDLFVHKTIHLCGEAFCQLFLSFVFTSLRTLYGISQTLLLMASMMINFIPLSLLVTRHREESVTLRIPTAVVPPEHRIALNLNNLSNINADQFQRSHSLKSIGELDGFEMQPKLWKNPLANSELNYMSVDQEDYNCCNSFNFNENGVEIMEIIPEEDENVSIIRSSTNTIDNIRIIDHSMPSHLNEILEERAEECRDDTAGGRPLNKREQILRMQEISINLKKQFFSNTLELLIQPLKKAIILFKLYPATLLASADTFSYVMCLTVLPGIAVDLHALKFAEIPFLFSLIAFPWMCFGLMTPRFGQTLERSNVRWHAVGCIAKSLALTCISVSSSKLLLSVSSVLLGFGQAVSLFLQDGVIKSSMPLAQWAEIKFPLYATNGILIMIWGTLAHLVVINISFQAAVGISVSSSKLLLSVSSVLLGFGQAVSLFLQDGVIKSSMPLAQWAEIKFPLYATNGILIMIWGTLAHLVVINISFQAAVGLSAIIYIFSIIIWFIVYFCIRF